MGHREFPASSADAVATLGATPADALEVRAKLAAGGRPIVMRTG